VGFDFGVVCRFCLCGMDCLRGWFSVCFRWCFLLDCSIGYLVFDYFVFGFSLN